MRPLNEVEWKKLQESVKITDEYSSIGVEFYNASFILSEDGIISNYKPDPRDKIKESTTSRKSMDSEKETVKKIKKLREIKYTIAPPRNPKNKKSIMEELRQLFHLTIILEKQKKR